MMSLLFYFWGGAAFFSVMLFSILVNYLGGRIVDAARDRGKRKCCKAAFIVVVSLNLLNLVYWKYMVFLMESVRKLIGWNVEIPEILLPIGISFFTFQGMSYVIDLYRGEVPVHNYIRMFLKDDIAESFAETLSVDWANISVIDRLVEAYQPDIVVLESTDSCLGAVIESVNGIRTDGWD